MIRCHGVFIPSGEFVMNIWMTILLVFGASSCGSSINEMAVLLSEEEMQEVETYSKFCQGSQGGETVKVVLDSSVKKLPSVEYKPPLSKILITGGFECRSGAFHGAIDLVDLLGTPVTAIADGVVRYSGQQRLTGKTVVIFHPESGVESLYGHGDQNLVKAGELIKRGQSIQLLGNTGSSTGPHLHLQTTYKGAFINPCTLIGCKN
ncbi:MAG: M23 family metallopeptidase [Proteobacteria bacterium]|nr:M23 family metallopeptidase [Pseudomonadota bacterium]